MQSLRKRIHPGIRGALYTGSYWGVFGILEPFINVHFLHLGLTSSQIGWLSTLSPLAVLTIAPFIANYADRTRRRTAVVAAATVGVSLSLVLLNFPRTFTGFLPIFALYAVFLSPINSITDGLLARMARNFRLDYGRVRLWGSVGYGLTSISMGAVYTRIGYDAIFLVTGLLILPVSLLSLLLEEPETETSDAGHVTSPGRIDWGLVSLVSATFLVGAAQYLSYIFRGIYMESLGGGEFMIGLVVGITALTEFPTMIYAMRVFRRLGGTRTLLFSYILLSIGIMGYAFTNSPWVLILLSGLKGLGFGLYAVSTVVIIDQHAPAEKVASYQSITAALAWGLAPLISGLFGGGLYDLNGGKTLFLVAGFLPLLSMIALLPTFFIWKSSHPDNPGAKALPE